MADSICQQKQIIIYDRFIFNKMKSQFMANSIKLKYFQMQSQQILYKDYESSQYIKKITKSQFQITNIMKKRPNSVSTRKLKNNPNQTEKKLPLEYSSIKSTTKDSLQLFVLDKTKLLSTLSTYKPHLLKHVIIKTQYNQKASHSFTVPIHKDSHIHNLELQSIISYFTDWKTNIKSKLKHLQNAIVSTNLQSMNLSSIAHFRKHLFQQLQQAQVVNLKILKYFERFIEKQSKQLIDNQLQFCLDHPIHRPQPLSKQAQTVKTSQNHMKMTHIFKDFKDFHQVITAILEIFKFIHSVTIISKRDDISLEQKQKKTVCFEDLEDAIINGDEERVGKLEAKLLQELWPLVDVKIKEAVVMCVCKNIDYFEKDQSGELTNQFLVEGRLTKISNKFERISSANRFKSHVKANEMAMSKKEHIMNLNLVEFKVKKMFPFFVMAMIEGVRHNTTMKRQISYFKNYLLSSLRNLCQIFQVPQQGRNPKDPASDYNQWKELTNRILVAVKQLNNKVEDYSIIMGGQQNLDTDKYSQQINKTIKRQITPLIDMTKVAFQFAFMRLVGILRNQILKEDSILHLVRNDSMPYRLIKEAMILVNQMLSVNVVLIADTIQTKQTNTDSKFSFFLSKILRDYSPLLVEILEKEVEIRLIAKSNFGRNFSSTGLIISFFEQVREVVWEFSNARRRIIELVDLGLINQYVMRMLPVTKNLIETTPQREGQLMDEWQQIFELIQYSHNNLQHVISLIKAQQQSPVISQSRKQLANLQSFIDLLKYSQVTAPSLELLKQPKTYFSKLESKSINLLTHPIFMNELSFLCDKQKAYVKLLEDEELLEYVTAKPQLGLGLVEAMVGNGHTVQNQILQQPSKIPVKRQLNKQSKLNYKEKLNETSKLSYQEQMNKSIDELVLGLQSNHKKFNRKNHKLHSSKKQHKSLNQSDQKDGTVEMRNLPNRSSNKQKNLLVMQKNQAKTPLQLIFPKVPLFASPQSISPSLTVHNNLPQQFPTSQAQPCPSPISESPHISQILLQSLLLAFPILEQVRQTTLELNQRVGYTIDDFNELSQLQLFNVWVDERCAELEQINNGSQVVQVINEMIALAIRQWGQVMKRNAFFKSIDLGYCLRALFLSYGIKADHNYVPIDSVKQQSSHQVVNQQLIKNDIQAHFTQLLKTAETSSPIIESKKDSNLQTNLLTLQAIIRTMKLSKYSELNLNLKKFMAANDITCLEYTINNDAQKGLSFSLDEEQRKGSLFDDGLLSRVILLKKGIKSKSSSNKFIQNDGTGERQPISSIFGRNRPQSPSSPSNRPKIFSDIFAQLLKSPQYIANPQCSTESPNLQVEIVLSQPVIQQLLIMFFPSVIGRYKRADEKQAYEYFDYYNMSLEKSVQEFIGLVHAQNFSKQYAQVKLKKAVEQVNGGIESLVDEICRIIANQSFKPFIASQPSLIVFENLDRVLRQKFTRITESWLIHNLRGTSVFALLQEREAIKDLNKSPIYASFRNRNKLFSSKIINEGKSKYITDEFAQEITNQKTENIDNKISPSILENYKTLKQILKCLQFQSIVSNSDLSSGYKIFGVKSYENNFSSLIRIVIQDPTISIPKHQNQSHFNLLIESTQLLLSAKSANYPFTAFDILMKEKNLYNKYLHCLSTTQLNKLWPKYSSLPLNQQILINQQLYCPKPQTQESNLHTNKLSYTIIDLSRLLQNFIVRELIINHGLTIIHDTLINFQSKQHTQPIKTHPYFINIVKTLLQGINNSDIEREMQQNYGDQFFGDLFPSFLNRNNLAQKYVEQSNKTAKNLQLVNFFFNQHYKTLKKYMQTTNESNRNDKMEDCIRKDKSSQTGLQISVNRIIGNLIEFWNSFVNKQPNLPQLSTFTSLKQQTYTKSMIRGLETRESLIESLYSQIKQTIKIESDFIDLFNLSFNICNQNSLKLIRINSIAKYKQDQNEKKIQLIGLLIQSQTIQIDQKQFYSESDETLLNLEKVLLLQTNTNKPNKPFCTLINPIEKFILQNYFWPRQSPIYTPQFIKQLLISDKQLEYQYVTLFRQNVQITEITHNIKVEGKIQLPNKPNQPMIVNVGQPVIDSKLIVNQTSTLKVEQFQCLIKDKFILLGFFQPTRCLRLQLKGQASKNVLPLLLPARQRLRQYMKALSELQSNQLSVISLSQQISEIAYYAEWKRRLMSDSSLIISNKSIGQQNPAQNSAQYIFRLRVLEDVLKQRISAESLLNTENALLLETNCNKQYNSVMKQSVIHRIDRIVFNQNQKKSIFADLDLAQLTKQVFGPGTKPNEGVKKQKHIEDGQDLEKSQLMSILGQLQLESIIQNKSQSPVKDLYQAKDWITSSSLSELIELNEQFSQRFKPNTSLYTFSHFQLILQQLFCHKDRFHQLYDPTFKFEPFNQVSPATVLWLEHIQLQLRLKQTSSHLHTQVVQQKLLEIDTDISNKILPAIHSFNKLIEEFIEQRKYISAQQRLQPSQMLLQLDKILQILLLFINLIVQSIKKHTFFQYSRENKIEVEPVIVYNGNNYKEPTRLVNLDLHLIQVNSPFTAEHFPLKHSNSQIQMPAQLLARVLSSLITQVIFGDQCFLPLNSLTAQFSAQFHTLEDRLKNLYSQIPFRQMEMILEWREQRAEQELKRNKLKHQANAKKILFKILVLWGELLFNLSFQENPPNQQIIQPTIQAFEVIEQILGKPQAYLPQPDPAPPKRQLHHYWKKGMNPNLSQNSSQLQLQFDLSDDWEVDVIDFIDDLPKKKKQKLKLYQDNLLSRKKLQSPADLQDVSQISINLSEIEGSKILRNEFHEELNKSNYLFASHININKINKHN